MRRALGVVLNVLMAASAAFAGFALGALHGATPILHAPPSATIPMPVRAQAERLDISLDGRMLRLSGEIDPDAFRRFVLALDGAAAVNEVGLSSTGGSLDAALAIAVIIRSRGLDTRVPDGEICASSCPLILAAGQRRSVGAGAEVGVHQVTMDEAVLESQRSGSPGRFGLAAGQSVTAMIASHLQNMGVDPKIWLLGLTTPPERLRLLSADEMRQARLVNDAGGITPSDR